MPAVLSQWQRSSRRSRGAIRNAALAIVTVVVALALWAVLSLHRSPEGAPAARATTPATDAESAAVPQPGQDSAQRDASVTRPGAVREVPVFDGEFTVRLAAVDIDTDLRPRPRAVIEDYDLLAAAAHAGDANAAFALAMALTRCIGHPTSAEALHARVDRMQQTHVVESEGPPRFVSDIQSSIELERKRYEECRDLSEAQIASRYDWLELAADLGNYRAQLGALGNALERYWMIGGGVSPLEDEGYAGYVATLQAFGAAQPERLGTAIRHTMAARESGSLQALESVGMLYAAGLLAPDNGHSAAANAYACLRAASEAWDPSLYSLAAALPQLGSSLSPYELHWAEGQARALLRAPNCCKEW
jgi:hypothetical protein